MRRRRPRRDCRDVHRCTIALSVPHAAARTGGLCEIRCTRAERHEPAMEDVHRPRQERDGSQTGGVATVARSESPLGKTFAMPVPTRRAVVVVDYDEEWPRRFEELRRRTWPVVADVAVRIEHVGSTSVPRL